MKVELTVIEQLGLRMYTSLPPVISELVANCWDADARNVNVTVPEGSITDDSTISVEDDGCGMTFDEVNRAFLTVGRNRRTDNATDLSPTFHREVMGRKGIGKLSVFGVAKVVEVETTKSGVATAFRMDIEKIRSTRAGRDYEPEIIKPSALGRTQGTVVRLRGLKRTRSIDIDNVILKLARRFSIIGSNFVVRVNGNEVTPTERQLKGSLEHTWEIDELIEGHPEWRVKGWIGTSETPMEETQRGIAILARGKLIQEPSFFDVSGGQQYAWAYMVGELNAEFFDATDGEDLVGTNRSSIIWESEAGIAFRNWAQSKLKSISQDWATRRAEKREKVIREDSEFKPWLSSLSGPEKRVADKIISVVTSNEQLSPERRRELTSFVKESFDIQVFKDLAGNIGDNPEDAHLIELFMEWGLIEAREILRVAKGRIEVIEKFDRLIRTNAREVPEIHRFFAEYPWLLDPSWTVAYDEAHYSDLLREKFPNDILEDEDKRIDFVCLGAGDTVHVVELKRPSVKVGWKHLDQLEHYVSFIRGKLGTSPGRSYNSASGYLVAGDVDDKRETLDKINRVKGDRIYVLKYEDLLRMAKKLHSYLEERLAQFSQTRAKAIGRVPAQLAS